MVVGDVVNPFIFTFNPDISDDIPGCNDFAACNYNPDATEYDSSCLYPEPGFDCFGECGGGKLVDECGECDGINFDCCPGDMNDDDAMDILDVYLIQV